VVHKGEACAALEGEIDESRMSVAEPKDEPPDEPTLQMLRCEAAFTCARQSLGVLSEPESEPGGFEKLDSTERKDAENVDQERARSQAEVALHAESEERRSEPGGFQKLDSREKNDTENGNQERARSQAEVVLHAQSEETRLASSRECRRLASVLAEYLTCCKNEGSEVLPSAPCPIKEGLVSQLRLQFE